MTISGVWVEFDRVDSGRIVSLYIPAHPLARDLLVTPDADDDEVDGDIEDVWSALAPPPPNGPCTVEIDTSDTRLWNGRREFARAAELAEDAVSLAEEGDRSAAAIAYLEFAEVLRDLGTLAPIEPDDALQHVVTLMQGDPPFVYAEGEEPYQLLMKRVLSWAPDELAAALEPLRYPVVGRRPPRLDAFEPVDVSQPRALPHGEVLDLVHRANRLGREALRAESGDPGNASQAWRRCAVAWLDLGETGRAAIALDRAADAEARQGHERAAIEDRQSSQQVAPQWTHPVLGGRTGVPQTPLWSLVPSLPDTPGDAGHQGGGGPPRFSELPLPRELVMRVGGEWFVSSPLREMERRLMAPRRRIPGRSYVFISYAHDDWEYVRMLASGLEAAGVPVWHDRENIAGQRWHREVAARIDECAAMVVVMSEAAQASPWVDTQVARAQGRGRPVYPLLLSGEGLPRLANVHYERVQPRDLPSPELIAQMVMHVVPVKPTWAGREAPPLLGRGFPSPNPHFVGREDTLRLLADRLSGGRPVAVVARSGAKGVGTSALAAEFAHRHRGRYAGIAWINAEHPELIGDQYAALAPALGLSGDRVTAGVARQAITALADRGARWLFVFDNARRPEDLHRWLPPDGACDAIVTSERYGHWGLPTVDVGTMERDLAVQLLRERALRVGEEPAARIAALVDHLPLVLEQAAAYLATTGMGAVEFLESLRVGAAVAGELGYAEGTSDHAIHAMWDVGRTNLRPAGRALLELCSFLGSAPIPLQLFTQHADALPEELAGVARDVPAFSRTVDELVARSLVHLGSDGLTVHTLLATAVGRRMPVYRRQEAVTAVRELLARHLRDDEGRVGPAPRNVPVWRALMPLVLRATAENDPGPSRPGEDRKQALLAGAVDYLRSYSDPDGKDEPLDKPRYVREAGPAAARNEPMHHDEEGYGSHRPRDPNERTRPPDDPRP